MITAYILESTESMLSSPMWVQPLCGGWSLSCVMVVSPCIAQGVWHFWELSKQNCLLWLTKDRLGSFGVCFLWKKSRCISLKILGMLSLKTLLWEAGNLCQGSDHLLSYHVTFIFWFTLLLYRLTLGLTWYAVLLVCWALATFKCFAHLCPESGCYCLQKS